MNVITVALDRCTRRLLGRLEALEVQLDAGDDVWVAYATIGASLAAVAAQARPGANGEHVTTQDLADKLGVHPKTVLRWKGEGRITPALELGARGRSAIKWRADQVPDPAGSGRARSLAGRGGARRGR